MQSGETQPLRRPASSHLRGWVLLLLLLQLVPTVLLWRQRISDAFWWPFLGCWLCLPLFYRSSAGRRVVWGSGSRLLFVLSMLVLLLAVVLWSPWLGAAGLCLTLWAILRASQNRAGDRCLSRLVLLPVLATGLPRSISRLAAPWLQETLTWLVNLRALESGWEQWSDGGQLISPAGTFSVAAICWSPCAWSGGMVLALCWSLLQRRSVVQSVCLLGLSFLLGCGAIAAASLYGAYLLHAGGVGHSNTMLLLTLLAGQLLLLVSADSLVLFLTSPVLRPELLEQRGESGLFEQELPNPLEVLWNRFVAAERRAFCQVIAVRLPDGDPLPWAKLFRMVFELWLGSRNVWFLLGGVPVLSLSLLLGNSIRGISVLSAEQAVIRAGRLDEALEQRDPVAARVAHDVLLGLRPNDQQATFRYAEFLWEVGDREEAWERMYGLAQLGPASLPAAQMWLVQRSRERTPWRRLSDAECQGLLQQVIQREPSNARAHAWLAELLLRGGETKLAERALERASDLDLQYVSSLLRLRQRMGRLRLPDERLERAIRELGGQLQSAPTDADLRLRQADLLLLAERSEEAERLLRQANAVGAEPKLKAGLCGVLLQRVRRMLDGGEFDGMAAIRWLEEAVLLDPRQLEAVNLAVRLRTVGVTLRPDVVASLGAAWPAAAAGESGQEAPERALQRHLVRVLSEGTVGELHPDVADALQVSLLVQLLRVLGAEDEAGRVADQLLARLAALPVTGARSERRVEILLAAGRFAEVRVVLKSLLGRNSPWNTAALQRLQGLALVAEYDVLAGRPSADWRVLSGWLPPLASEEEVGPRLKLLEAALANTAVVAQAIDRLSREVLAGGGTRPGAERLLTQLQSTGRNVAVIWTKMAGTAAGVGRYSEAVQWYRKSLQLTNERGYGLLNNLAFCLIRSSGVAAAEEAFALVQEGLQQAPDHPALLATRGEILLRQGLVVRARADLERALDLNPGGVDVQTLLREIYEREGDQQGLERLQGLQVQP